MFQEAFQKRPIIIMCLILVIVGFIAGTQSKSFRGVKEKSANAVMLVTTETTS